MVWSTEPRSDFRTVTSGDLCTSAHKECILAGSCVGPLLRGELVDIRFALAAQRSFQSGLYPADRWAA
jgi:hypothetical protein